MTTPPDPALPVALTALLITMLRTVARGQITDRPGSHVRYSRRDGAPLDVAELAALDRARQLELITLGALDDPYSGHHAIALTVGGIGLLAAACARH